ncbi:condensation domain-containing protein (plasmid) [Streptomyces sp. CA-294286]|uniref:condensation domain-containing protein n=1 Tax=Streptomyces sp. CA-294286 TaxID=3240070 RepID=UPI003D8C6373
MSPDTPAALQQELLRRARSRTAPRPAAPAPAGTDPDAGSGSDTGRAPLSHAQRRMWLMDRLGHRDGAYSVPFATRLSGPLDLDALGEALSALVARHTILRTRYGVHDDVPYQETLPALDTYPVRVVDTDTVGGPGYDDLLTAEARLPFDLSAGPLPRALVLRHGPEDHTVLLTLHHISVDGHSLETVADELSALYAHATGASAPPLPAAPPQYAEHARREHAAAGRLTGSLDHWARRLAGAVPPALPRPAAPPSDLPDRPAATVLVPLAPDVPDTLREWGRTRRATLFTVQLAAAFAALHRLTGADDLVIGCAAGHREGREAAGLVGLCVNTLAVRVDASGDPAFGELVERVRDALLEAQQHRQVPYDLVMERLGAAARGADGSALVRVTSDVLGEPTALRLPGLRAEAVEVELSEAKFDLSFGLVTAGKPSSLVQYGRAALDDGTGQALGRSFAELLTAVAADPARRLSELPGPAGSERDTAHPASATDADPAAHPALAALRALPHVADAVVVDPPGGPLLAYAVLREWSGPTPAQLRAALRGVLDGDRLPLAVTLVDALPRTADGSPDLTRLPGAPATATATATASASAPASASASASDGAPSPHAEAVTAAFAHVLGRRPAPDDDFFALGGHSLTAVQLAERLRTGLELPLTGLDIMEARTPHALTALLDDRARARTAARRAAATAAAGRSAKRRTVAPGTVLVTGGTGGVGAFVLRELAARGRPVLALARPESAHLVAGEGVEVVEGDLGDPDGLRRAVAGVDAVIHAACTFTRPEVDVAAMRAMAEAWNKGPFVFVSSVDAYGHPADGWVPEESPSRQPLSPYGQAKVDCEALLLRAAGTGGRGGASAVRSPLVWGAHDRLRDQLRWGAIGLLYQAARAHAPITLPAPGAGGHEWYGAPWVHAAALARAVTACLDAPVHGVANAVSGHVGWPELTEELRTLLGSDSPVRYDARVHPDLDHHWHYRADRLAPALRPEPGEDLRTVLADMVVPGAS